MRRTYNKDWHARAHTTLPEPGHSAALAPAAGCRGETLVSDRQADRQTDRRPGPGLKDSQ
jgi:hypothetical protein